VGHPKGGEVPLAYMIGPCGGESWNENWVRMLGGGGGPGGGLEWRPTRRKGKRSVLFWADSFGGTSTLRGGGRVEMGIIVRKSGVTDVTSEVLQKIIYLG